MDLITVHPPCLIKYALKYCIHYALIHLFAYKWNIQKLEVPDGVYLNVHGLNSTKHIFGMHFVLALFILPRCTVHSRHTVVCVSGS